MRQISESAAALVKKIFERNAEATAAYVTSDDQVFQSHNDALGQAGNLKRAGKSDEVTTIPRAESGEQGAEGKQSIGKAVAKALIDAVKSGEIGQLNTKLPATDGGNDGGKGTELTVKQKAAKAVELATAKRAEAQAAYDAAVENKGSLPEGAHVNTVRAADKRIEKALAGLTEADSELAAAEAALADVDGE